MNRPIRPPTRAPTIPIMVVTNRPPGSLPGIRNFAINPTTSPNRMNPMISMRPSFRGQHPPDEHGGNAGDGGLGQGVREDVLEAGCDPGGAGVGAAARLVRRWPGQDLAQAARLLVEVADAAGQIVGAAGSRARTRLRKRDAAGPDALLDGPQQVSLFRRRQSGQRLSHRGLIILSRHFVGHLSVPVQHLAIRVSLPRWPLLVAPREVLILLLLLPAPEQCLEEIHAHLPFGDRNRAIARFSLSLAVAPSSRLRPSRQCTAAERACGRTVRETR